MKREETFCQSLGLKQEDIAMYLEVSVDLMSQYEIGRRSLPSPAMIKLGKMEILLMQENKANKTTPELPFARGHKEKTAKILERHASNCYYKALLAERKLEAMKKICTQNKQLLILIAALDANEPEGTMDKLWLDLQKRQAHEKLERNGLPAQTTLQLRINGLRWQEEKAKEMLAQLADGGTPTEKL